MLSYISTFLNEMWRIFVSATVPGFSFTFGDLFLASMVVSVVGYVLRVLLRIQSVGNSYRAGRSARAKEKLAKAKKKYGGG